MTSKTSKVHRTEDSLEILSDDGETIATFTAMGGPDDPLEVTTGAGTILLDRAEVERFQESLINFLNTGYFDQEG